MIHRDNKRLIEIDSLRGIAAFSVVLFHYLSRYNHENINFPKIFDFGGLGVNLFFIISGFVIYMSLNNTSTIRSFIISRFSRLYPPYWSAIIFTSVFIFIFKEELNINQILVNFSMFQYWFRIDHIDGVYWTLRVEMSYYLLMIAIFIFSKKLIKKENIFIIWLAFQIILNYFIMQYLNVDNFFIKLINVFFILDFAHLFITGMMLYNIFQNINMKKSYVIIGLSVITSFFIDDLVHFLAFACFIIIFFSIFKFNISFLKNKILIFLGTISYSLYLLHQVIGYIIMDYLYKFDINTYFIITLTICILIILSYINWKIFESIASYKLKNILKKWIA